MLQQVLPQLLAVMLVMLATAALVFVGRERLSRTRYEYRDRFSAVAPYVGLLCIVLIANKIARDIGPELSWLIGISITPLLQRVDGVILWPLFGTETPQFVMWIQTLATPELTAYFSFIYIYGYVFLLVFPLIAYFALPKPEPLRRTIVAYGANYIIGVLCYIVLIAYGPRLMIPEQVDGLLFTHYSEYQFLTKEINDQTNVFPSLHTSMAVTAAHLAWLSRDEYPTWAPLAAVIAVSVVIATMYLGIHWATDVIFGIMLGYVSVRIGVYMEDTPPSLEKIRGRADSLWRAIPGRSR
ncbi:inositol phosphorylceramide synthase [Natronomonas halophila]|uniref:phosphatase PAP2 family protein n=1 Tax=Natronomonas halophila TaxID=2747817 RepID=UPI0015B51571|nr:phosphatase PAP2 family protein [Natronomonas halophila]QLD85017.1 inositol phosphorylceramide synthase [Natronomonas halophila]